MLMWDQRSNKKSPLWKGLHFKSQYITFENVKFLETIIGDSVITNDEITDVAETEYSKTIPTKTIPKSLNEKR